MHKKLKRKNFKRNGYLLLGLLVAAAILVLGIQTISAQTTNLVGDIGNGASLLVNGQIITPTAAPGSTYATLATGVRSDGNADAAEAVSTDLSPDGKTLLVLTSGYNRNYRDETTGQNIIYPVLDPVTGAETTTTTNKAEWVFVFDVSSGLVKKQQINIPNTYIGLRWAPDGQRFYVSGGADDRVYVYRFDGNQYVPDAPFVLLGHNANQTAPFPTYNGGLLKGTPAATAATGAAVAGLGVSGDGSTLFAANFQNDSLSIVNATTRQIQREIQFFKPGDQVATGEFPFDVAVYNNFNRAATKVFVTSQRDDEVLAVDVVTNAVIRIKVGSQPNKLLLSADRRRLYVANGNSDSVTVIDPVTNKVLQTISLARSNYNYQGSNPNSLALSPDGKRLYVTLGGENAVAVVDLPGGRVRGRIPTGHYPTAVGVSADGSRLFVVNAKSNAGANPANSLTTEAGRASNTTFQNQYGWALMKAGISTIPVPDEQTLTALSQQVDRNNGFNNRNSDPLMRYLQRRIHHVIYIVKENRTYDQVLGDLPIGNGDPSLTLFPEPISPNHHKLALDFVTLDNFYDSGESSGVGWNWSTYARTTDYAEKTQAVNYGNGSGLNTITYDAEGTNRNINIGLPQSGEASILTTRRTGILDPSGNSSILPGTKDVNAPAGDGNLESSAIGGYLWDAALRAGKTVRNYGFYVDGQYGTNQADPTQPDPNNPLYLPISRTPFADNIPQAVARKPVLQDKTDIYFRGYDQKNADIYLYEEWKREFDRYVAGNNLPSLTLLRVPHDHFGNFNNAVAGLNTADSQMADNDYAIAKIVEDVSKSVYWRNTAIFIVEDDAQNGPDHVDAHRSVAYIVSPYTKRGALVSTNYNTVSFLRTMEDLLGIDYLGLLDANTLPMSDVFTRQPDFRTYTAIIPGILCQAPVDPNLVPECANSSAPKTAVVRPKHNANWWAKATKGFNFAVEDKLDPDAFNQVLWAGIRGENVPYPTERNHANLQQNRTQLLEKWRNEDKLAAAM